MLIAALAPLLALYKLSLTIDLIEGDNIVMTIVPSRTDKAKDKDDINPIMLSGTVSEIDAALAQGTFGPLGELVTARVSLAEQIQAQIDAANAAKAEAAAATASKAAKKTAKATPAPAAKAAANPTDEPDDGSAEAAVEAAAEATPAEPASLW